MHLANAVISGGVRRSATIALFSADDTEMLHAKTGNWIQENPQRARSNNSVVLQRDKVSAHEFSAILRTVKAFGEPGFVWTDDLEGVVNPCVEIGMYARDSDGTSGWQACNLCEINMQLVRSKKDFLDACEIAAFIGTMQAGYTSFPYLGQATENIVRREALLGVSMTGMMDNPEFSFNYTLQREGAARVRDMNRNIAPLLGINPAARTTCVKPAGSTSCILGTASGIHPHHSRRYFRRVQVNRLEKTLQFLKSTHQAMVEPSVWGNNADEVITFLCEAPENAITKDRLSALDFLYMVRETQKNWVVQGRNAELCVKPWLMHNVSNTVVVKPDEWDVVGKYIYENRQYFTGVSLLSDSGDKDYAQAPFEKVLSPDEIMRTCTENGEALFVLPLVHAAIKAFGTLQEACYALTQRIRDPDVEKCTAQIRAGQYEEQHGPRLSETMAKVTWLLQAGEFATTHCGGDKTRLIMLMKNVDAWTKWCNLRRLPPVDWTMFSEQSDDYHRSELPECQGSNGCEIQRI
jgi:ribonucleoside-diphosphate reductase alpha chain